jgi:hypothetical protein
VSQVIVPDYSAFILKDIAVDVPALANRSIITSYRQVVAQPGAERWYLSAIIDPLVTENDEKAWRAFLFGLRGIRNYFHYRVACQTHSGSRPTVDTGATNGYSIPLTGMTPSTTILKAGDYMTVPLPSGHRRLVMLLLDLVTNSAGKATATLNVALNEVPAAGGLVETLAPFVPVSSTERRMGISYNNSVGNISLTLEEAV